MLGLDILFTALGFPIGVLANLEYDKLRHFAEEIEGIPLQSLFIKAFYKSLSHYGKSYGEVVKNLKKAIKDGEPLFIQIFNLEAENFNGFISKLKSGQFQETVARNIVNRFEVEDNFKEVMVLIVRDCLKNYQSVFLKTMTEKQGIQLILLLQGHNLDITLNAIEELGKTLVSEFKKIVEKEAETGKDTIEPKKKQKQIKILSITASPEGVDSINYEMEQDIMLEAFRSFEQEEVFLDMPDPVKSTLTEIADHLNDGKHDILHITAHGSINKKGEGILVPIGGKGGSELISRITGQRHRHQRSFGHSRPGTLEPVPSCRHQQDHRRNTDDPCRSPPLHSGHSGSDAGQAAGIRLLLQLLEQ